MSLSERRTEFLALRISQGLARRGLFRQMNPGSLADAVREVFTEEARKEKAIDEEARRLLEAARTDIAAGGVDSNELFRKIRKKLAEQKGIVL
jgi:hypothetical protein